MPTKKVQSPAAIGQQRRGFERTLTDRTPAEIAALLDELADITGESCYRRAARAIGQGSGGRPAIDDRRLISQAKQLVADGRAPSMNAALRKVARSVPGANVRSVAERLRRKIAAE